MEPWLVERFENRPDGFLHHAIHHVGNPQPALSAPTLRNPHPPDISRDIATV
jgi:hypothetical protein